MCDLGYVGFGLIVQNQALKKLSWEIPSFENQVMKQAVKQAVTIVP